MPPLPCNDNNGQVLLVAVVVVGLTALIIASSILLLSIGSFKVVIVAGQASKAIALNQACAEEALLRLKQDNHYIGAGSLRLDFEECFFTVSDLGGNNRLIAVSGVVGKVVKKVEIKLSVANGALVIKSWREIP